MSLVIDPEPDPAVSMLRVGHDGCGHWLVQESAGRLEGCFVSFAAAMAFARGERHAAPDVAIVVATAPLVPIISFAPVADQERALCHAG